MHCKSFESFKNLFEDKEKTIVVFWHLWLSATGKIIRIILFVGQFLDQSWLGKWKSNIDLGK